MFVPSRRKLIGPGAGLVFLSIIIATTGDRSLSEDWPVVVLLLFFAVVFVWVSLPGGAYIRLSKAGVELKFTWWKRLVPWHEIEACRATDGFAGKRLLVKRVRHDGVGGRRYRFWWRSYLVPDVFELGPERLADEIEMRRAECRRVERSGPGDRLTR